jgi:predicted HD phosphohydrolase
VTTPFELSAAQRADFARDGWLLIRGALDAARVEEIRAWVAEVALWAEIDGPGLHHHEQTASGPRIARSEDLVPHHAGLRSLLCEGGVPQVLGQLFGEPALLFKEKINYKHPGGGGFAPHQDASAYRFVDHHISVMLPIDPATRESGCLWVARGFEQGQMPTAAGGRIEADFAATLDWQPVEVFPGDLLFFDSYTPHYSETNQTDRPRRALYLTYNGAQHGDQRERYYADKKAEFAAAGGTFGGERVRISVSDDFLGKPVNARRSLDDLFGRFRGEAAHQLYDEAVTELGHGLQAAELAIAEGADDALVAAALLHDVGHLLVGDLFPIDQPLTKDFVHEEVGARYLAKWFGPEVTEPVRLNVAAKRYLVATDPAYFATLSPSSVRSLEVQGGAMSDAEVAAFRALPGWEGAVRLRIWDDLAKDADASPRPFAHHEPMLRALAG